MRLLYCLGWSLLVHILLIKSLVLGFNRPPTVDVQTLHITLLKKLTSQVNSTPLLPMSLPQYFSEPLLDEKVKILPKLDFVDMKYFGNQINEQEQIQSTSSDKTIDTFNYYSSDEVERKALPQVNIDMSNMESNEYSGLPIKLRLYINAYGRLVKIERIAVLDQDEVYVSALEKLLFELVYMPAKKDNLDVNVYQDVELSFNPIHLPIQSAGSNQSIN